MSDVHGTFSGQACDNSGPAFREPWEAQAFAIALSLHQRGVFSWPEWTCALAAQISTAQTTGDADSTYYRCWLATLESLVAAKGVASIDELNACQRVWQVAAERPPHGQPLQLEPGGS